MLEFKQTILLAYVYCFGQQNKSFCYLLHKEEDNNLGSIVKVSFGKKELYGVILKIEEQEIINEQIVFNNKKLKIEKIKFIKEIIFRNFLTNNFINFLQKMSFYNVINIERLIQNVIPSFWINKKKELTKNVKNKKYKKTKNTIVLTKEQNDIVEKIYQKTQEKNFNVAVLRGVMGSGKTYIFLEFVKRILAEDQTSQVLIMVPEIALTGQFINIIYNFCNIEPIIWHSSISVAKKKRYYEDIIYGKARIVISTRSGLLLPYKNLKAIVIDEEHDLSYKQNEIPCYNARDMAILRAKYENIPVILSSATPSIETIQNIVDKKYDIYNINQQFFHIKPPEIILINTKK